MDLLVQQLLDPYHRHAANTTSFILFVLLLLWTTTTTTTNSFLFGIPMSRTTTTTTTTRVPWFQPHSDLGRPQQQQRPQHQLQYQLQHQHHQQQPQHLLGRRRDVVRLFSGRGIAKGYTWQEEAFEIDVTVKVPKETRAKDIIFKATSRSIDLRLKLPNHDHDNGNNSSHDEKILLNGNRTLRGRVSLDGTYWVLSDVTQDDDMVLAVPYREVTVTIEKLIQTPQDDFEIVQYDWEGLYLDDDDLCEDGSGEVIVREYDAPEELNVHDYAQSLGVDLDNLNMSLVDKTMFSSSNFNVTQSTLNELTKAGLLTEVTQQADGSEFVVNPNTGEPEPWVGTTSMSSFQDDGEGLSSSDKNSKKTIPFLDTNSPWHQSNTTSTTTIPTTTTNNNNKKDTSPTRIDEKDDVVQQKRYFTRAAFAEDAAAAAAATTKPSKDTNHHHQEEGDSMEQDDDDDDDAEEEEDDDDEDNDLTDKAAIAAAAAAAASDPIDLLTVKKLKEILRSQGLKVSGNKKELQDRLRQQVNALLQGEQ